MSNKIKVGLIYGGRSGEHDVSLQTALAVIQAFDYSKYEIHPFYIDKQGVWSGGPLLQEPVTNKSELLFDGKSVGDARMLSARMLPEQTDDQTTASTAPLDVVFPLLHGTYGEDGTIQGLLEMSGVPYVGAGVLASAVGMDKVMMKKMFAQEGLPQCLYRYFTSKQWEKDQAFFIMEIEISLGYPCFVKPANLGSSVGVAKANNREELIEAVGEALRFDRKVIVEEFVDAREIEIGVLGNDDPQASVPGEIVASNEFYDYNAKYVDGKSSMIIPADVSDETAAQLGELAVRAFMAIDGSGLSRVDFFVDRQDPERIMINEINTMPGFTPFSMYPLLWKHTGKSYTELLDDLIQLAIERYEEKQALAYSKD